jgi:protein-glutamine gamma-glutamyltransferase
MYLERLLQINMATLAALGALLLGMGQRSEWPPLLVIVAAAASVWLTDVTRRIRIGRWTANVLMLAGAIFSLHDVYPPRSETQTIGLSWFLIYLQVILLFQEKDQWKYWLLVMLSLLEVVMATLFSQGMWFGILLVIYMLLGFSAMTLLMVFRQQTLFVKRAAIGPRRSLPAGWKFLAAVRVALSADRNVRPTAAGERKTLPNVATSIGPAPLTRQAEQSRRWPLSARQAEFTSVPGGSSHAGVGRDLFGRLSRMGFHTMALTLVLFFAVPRFALVAWQGPLAAKPQPLVGFTDQVTLGELGSIIESHEAVMQVGFYRESSDTPKPLQSDVYLQGAYLQRYQNGRWRAWPVTGNPGDGMLQQSKKLPPGVVRLKVTIESLDHRELFYVAPYMAIGDYNPPITADGVMMRLYRSDHDCQKQFRYTLGTTAIIKDEQLPLTPAVENEAQYAGISRDRLPELAKLADRWIAADNLTKADNYRRARCLEHNLSTSDQFQYSLTGVERDPSIDPIEDFIRNHPQGHCEYFATALTLMLRSQGIPSRMVSGFKIDNNDWNAMGGYYQVRQYHAHAWVEAYLPPEQLVLHPDLVHGTIYWGVGDDRRSWRYGGWLRLDATPAGFRDASENWFTPVRKGFDWLDGAWSKYFVELDRQTQSEAIYQPIADAARNFWQAATSAQYWQTLFDSVSVALYLDHLGREVKWALLGVIGVTAMMALAGMCVAVLRISRRLWSRSTGNHGRRRGRRGVEVAFYRRFESLMARQGLVRAPAQTQHEFAAAAGTRLTSLTGERRLTVLAELIAEAFYHVRFGRTPLDNLQTQAVEQALVEIAAIRKNRRFGS